MEQFSMAYVRAIGAAAGYSFVSHDVDDDSIDGGFASKEGRRRRLEFQLKSTSNIKIKNGHINYQLPIKNYNDLRLDDPTIPRILILLLMPEKIENWTTFSESGLCLHHCAYWHNLAGMKETSNETTVTLSIPCAQQFSPEALTQLMQKGITK